MNNIARLPLDTAAFDRLTANQRNANIAEGRAEHVQTARAILRGQDRYSNDVLSDACAALQSWGDGFDRLTAAAMIQTLNRREWQARNLPQETPADVAWPYRWQAAAWALGFALAVVVAVVLP